MQSSPSVSEADSIEATPLRTLSACGEGRGGGATYAVARGFPRSPQPQADAAADTLAAPRGARTATLPASGDGADRARGWTRRLRIESGRSLAPATPRKHFDSSGKSPVIFTSRHCQTPMPLPRGGLFGAIAGRHPHLTLDVAPARHGDSIASRVAEPRAKIREPLERDAFCLSRSAGWLGPPRPACGERSNSRHANSGEGGSPRGRCLWKQPLTPTLSGRASPDPASGARERTWRAAPDRSDFIMPKETTT